MRYSASASCARNGIILGRPCFQLDQALSGLTQQLANQAAQCGLTLIIIDHREQMAMLFDHDDAQPISIDFGGEQRLTPW